MLYVNSERIFFAHQISFKSVQLFGRDWITRISDNSLMALLEEKLVVDNFVRHLQQLSGYISNLVQIHNQLSINRSSNYYVDRF